MKFRKIWLAVAGSTALALAGCGDSGSSPSTTPAPTPSNTITLSGTAASGAAFVDAVVTVIDSTGALVGTSSPVGTDGKYTVTLKEGAKAPFVLVASRTTADGQVQSLVSVVESTTATTANVTPITNLIAARLSKSGDPSKLASELAAGTTQITAAAVAATVSEVKAILAPLLNATGTSTSDPLKDTFTVDGTGYDRLLDSISINIIPASATSSNIEIAVKQALPDGQQPASITFSSTSTTVAPLPAVDSTTLVESGTSVLIADFLKQLTACFALPLNDRVVTGGTTADDIAAPACKSAFLSGTPATFRSNGNVVGKGKSFNGIFVEGATATVFNQGSYEFTRGNGDLVIGYKSKDSASNETFDTLVVRKDTDGKLKLIGNQYLYPGGVSAYQQYRQFITLNQSAYNYHSTGYTLNVRDVIGAGGGSIFDRVVVTTPSGNTVVLKPSAGSANLNLVKSSGVSGTNFIRLRSVFSDSATAGDPSTVDDGLFFAAEPLTDTQISTLAGQSAWHFDYFLAGNTTTGALPDATQKYKTRARALTIAELKQQGLAQLTAAVISDIQADPNMLNGMPLLPGNEPVGPIDFAVPAGALPVTEIKIFGRMNINGVNRARFDDAVTIKSTARAGTVSCARASGSDLHCSTSVPGAYAASAYAIGLHLWARDSGGREYTNFYAMYPLTLP